MRLRPALMVTFCLLLSACGAAVAGTPGESGVGATPVDTVPATLSAPRSPTVTGATVEATAAVTGAAATGTPSAAATGTTTVTRTEVIDYQPAVPSLSEPGSCFTASLAVMRPGAYRCTVGNSILDPCFTAADGETIVCDADPVTESEGFRLDLSEPLPTPEPTVPGATGPAAWLIRFADGVYCNYATGATGGVGEERINYLCSDQSVVIGDIDTSGDVWTALRGTVQQDASGQFTSQDAAMAAIETAWR
ncbi:MAG: hypothetical protein ACYC5O_11185 [Anaerolineae bacterium]